MTRLCCCARRAPRQIANPFSFSGTPNIKKKKTQFKIAHGRRREVVRTSVRASEGERENRSGTTRNNRLFLSAAIFRHRCRCYRASYLLEVNLFLRHRSQTQLILISSIEWQCLKNSSCEFAQQGRQIHMQTGAPCFVVLVLSFGILVSSQ